MDLLVPLSTALIEHVDHNDSDTMTEIAALWERQNLVDQLLANEIPVSTLLDCLSCQGLNPDHYIDMAIRNIDAVLEGRVEIDNPHEIQIYRR